jgi:hypothetical protein
VTANINFDHYTVTCDEQIYEIIRLYKFYKDRQFRLYPIEFSFLTEEQIIFSRAAAKFQDLIIVDAF